jgi:predicted RND superfamily exporter protein
MSNFLKMMLATLPIYVVLFFLFFYSKEKLTPNEVINQLNQRDSVISKSFDKQGRLILEHTNREYNTTVIEKSDDAEMVKLREELKNMNIKVKDLKSAIDLQTEAMGKGQVQIVRLNDTLDTYTFSDTTGKHLKLKGKVNTKSNMLDYEYTYSANYKLFSYEYKKNVFKTPELRLKIISDDSSNTIKAQTFNVKTPREIVSIGAGIGASLIYDNNQVKVRPAIQVGIFKPIITFRSKK